MSSIKQGFLLILTMLIVAIGAFVWLSRDVVNIDWTPDGEWILFYCGSFGYTDPYSYLYITRPDGTEFQRISTQQFIATSPSWSPNGDWIAFINGTYGQDIYIMRPDGSEIRKLAEFSNMYRITSLVWLSQDKWVIYGINGGIFDPVTRIQMPRVYLRTSSVL